MKEYIVPVDESRLEQNELEWFKGQGAKELVRCKDCEYAPGNKEGYTCKIRDILGMYMKNPDYFFCADGKRKDM